MQVNFEAETPAIAKPRRKLERSPEEDRYNRDFGARIKAIRKRRGKTQREIAAALRIGHYQYLRHEMGDTAFPPYLLVSLAAILDRSVQWLVTGHD